MDQAASSDLQICNLWLKVKCESQGLWAEPRGRGGRAKDGVWEARGPWASISTRKEDAGRPSHLLHLHLTLQPLGWQRSPPLEGGGHMLLKDHAGT